MDFLINLKELLIVQRMSIHKQRLQVSIIAVVLLTSLIVSYWGSQTVILLFLLTISGVVAIFSLLWQPNLGFLLMLLCGMFTPAIGRGGLSAVPVVVVLMQLLLLGRMLVVRRKLEFVRSRAMIPVFVFLCSSTLSFGIGQIPWFIFARQAPLDSQLGGFSVFILSISLLPLSAHIIKDMRWLKIVVGVFLGLSAFYMVGRGVGGFSFITLLYESGFVGQSMFWTWLIAIAASQIIYNHNLIGWMKGILIALVVLTLLVAIRQGYEWKSGWVPPLMAIVVLVGIRYFKLVVFALPFLAVLASIFVINLILSESYSWGTRVEAWKIVLEIGRVSPLFGTGFANYYWYTPLIPILGYFVNFNSHSQFVDLIAQTGYLGFFGFLWLFFEVGRIAWNLAKQLPDGFLGAYAYGVLAGIIATMVAAVLGDWVLPFVYNVGLSGFRASVLPWIFMGGLLAIEQFIIRKGELV